MESNAISKIYASKETKITYNNEKRYESNIGKEVSRLAEPRRMELQTSTVCPHCNHVSNDGRLELADWDILKYRSNTNENPPPVIKNGVMNLQASGNGNLKIRGSRNAKYPKPTSPLWQSADSTNIAATNVLENIFSKVPR